MTLIRLFAVATILPAVTLATTLAAQTPNAALDRLAKARAAMGGAAELAAVKTLQISLHDRSVQGSMPGVTRAEPRFFESRSDIKVLLPDHLLWGGESITPVARPRSPWGFAGPRNIGGTPMMTPRYRDTFGYLMLALLLKTDTVFPFTVKSVQGDAIYLDDPDKFEVVVELDPVTSRPKQIRYVWVGRSETGLSGEQHSERIDIGDYAATGRLQLPRTLTTFREGTMILERRIDSIVLNPRLTPEDFK